MTKEKEFSVTKKFLEARSADKKIQDSDSGLKRYFTNDVTSELDTCLQGQAGSIEFKKMSRNDAVVGGMLNNYTNPIQSVNWSIEEIVDATPKEQEVVKILNKWFFERNNFGTQLNQILGMLPVGFSLFEKFFTKAEIDGQKYMMPILAERVQTSIRKIDYKTTQVEQRSTEGNYIYIPFKDLVFFTFRQDGNDRRGVSLLRQAYYDYINKREINAASSKGVIRSMLGLIVGKVPDTVNSESKDFDTFNDMVIDLGQRGFNGLSDSIVLPANYDIEIMTASFDLKAMKEYISHLDSSMAMSVLTQFMTLGQSGNGGSYSLGRDSSDLFLDGLQFIIDYIERVYSQEIIQQTVSMNWSDVDPTKFNLIGSNLNKKASKEFADTLGVMVDKGLIKPEPEDEVKLRKMYDLPDIDLKQRELEKDDQEEAIKDSEKEIVEDEKVIKEDKPVVKPEAKKAIKLSENWNTTPEREAYLDQEVAKLSTFSRASLTLIADEFSKTVRRQLNKGETDAQGLKDLKINNIGAYKKKLGQKISGVAMQAWNNAKRNSKGRIKLAETNPSELPTQVLTSFVLNQSDTMIDKQLNDIREIAILTANTEATKGLSTSNTMAIVDEKIDDYIANKNRIEGGLELATVQSMNYSEIQYYQTIEDSLWGYRFANDMPETAICKSLVGKTYAKGSPALDLVQPPLHFRCDSYLVPMYKDEAKPVLDNFIPPASILKQKTI